MIPTSRRQFLKGLASTAVVLPAGWGVELSAGQHLPLDRTFVGGAKFESILAKARGEGWARLPMGQRIQRVGQAMVGTPYVGFTLEIDDHVESPSVNFEGLDCWTFFEAAFCIARLLRRPVSQWTADGLLREIEITRYRGGVCRGDYLDRIHYLDEWFRDNEARGHLRDITADLGAVVPLTGRRIDEMTVLWKSYRYLKHNPGLRPRMAAIEAELQTHAFHYLPKAAVADIESRLRSGDIVGIVTHKPHVYCSHVGLAVPVEKGRCRFMHASQTHKRVMVDERLSVYLNRIKSHAGIVVARPVE